jgi:hypothetical protein
VCARYIVAILSRLPSVMRERKLASADSAMPSRVLSFHVMGCHMRVNSEYFSGARELWARKVYFTQPGFSVAAGNTVVDLGANVELFSLLAAKLGGRVIAVGMESGFVPIIDANVRANGVAETVDVLWVILAAGSGIVTDQSALRAASHYLEEALALSNGRTDWVARSAKDRFS